MKSKKALKAKAKLNAIKEGHARVEGKTVQPKATHARKARTHAGETGVKAVVTPQGRVTVEADKPNTIPTPKPRGGMMEYQTRLRPLRKLLDVTLELDATLKACKIKVNQTTRKGLSREIQKIVKALNADKVNIPSDLIYRMSLI